MPHAIEMLRLDQNKVKKLFDEFKHAEESQVKDQIVETSLRELEVHAALEEEIFYPAAEQQIDDKETIDEAREEHDVVKLLIGELKKMTAGDEQYDAKYTVLSENVKYHIQEEESGLFPSLKANLMRKNLGRKWKLVNRNFNDSFTNLRGAPNQKTRTRKRKGRQTAAKKARRKATGGRR